MTMEELGKKFFTLLIALVTICLIGSFVVSLNVVDFIYLLVLYLYIYLIYRSIKERKKTNNEDVEYRTYYR